MVYFKKLVLLYIGLSAGLLIDALPTVVTGYFSLRVCAESCPEWLHGYAIVVYAGVPLLLSFTTASSRSVEWKLNMFALAILIVLTLLILIHMH